MANKICVVIPAYNAASSIKDVVQGALMYCPDVLVLDDGSDDDTAQIAAEAGARIIAIPENKGKGNALKILFQVALEEGYDIVISIDADGQHETDKIPSFIEAHEEYPESIIVGSRMHEKENIPRNRFNVMQMANFYISLASNQRIEDSQCGYRLYPISLLKKIKLTTEKYVTETELLMKAGDSRATIRFIPVNAIYTDNGSHFRPVKDLAALILYVAFYITIKWLIEGIHPDKPFTYSPNNIRDKITSCNYVREFSQTVTFVLAVPLVFLFLLEYILLAPFLNNFASIRNIGCGFYNIAAATFILPIVLIIMTFEHMWNIMGGKMKVVDGFVERFYSKL